MEHTGLKDLTFYMACSMDMPNLLKSITTYLPGISSLYINVGVRLGGALLEQPHTLAALPCTQVCGLPSNALLVLSMCTKLEVLKLTWAIEGERIYARPLKHLGSLASCPLLRVLQLNEGYNYEWDEYEDLMYRGSF